jgi:DNA-binding NarL/FixJ family response regulator
MNVDSGNHGVVMNVRVFVANDHEILRGALRAVIDMQPDMAVVGEAATGPDAELGIKETTPDVVLMDIGAHNCGRRDAIAAVKRIRSETRIVVLTFQEELGYIRAAVRRRADGYVVKRALNTELLTAIRAVAQRPTDSADTRGTARPTERKAQVRSRARQTRPAMA